MTLPPGGAAAGGAAAAAAAQQQAAAAQQQRQAAQVGLSLPTCQEGFCWPSGRTGADMRQCKDDELRPCSLMPLHHNKCLLVRAC